MRIQLEVPEIEKPKALPVITMTHRVLEVTVRELSQEELQSLNWTKLDDGPEKSAKGTGTTGDSRRSKYHGDQRQGEGV